jgi:outer membrane protein assembly factor BamB
MRGKRMRCPNVICRAVFEARGDNDPAPVQVEALAKPSPPAADVPDDFPGDEEPASTPKAVEPTPKTVEMKKPEPVKRKPVPKPIEPEPMDVPDDFPGDGEAVTLASAPTLTLATEAWQPASLEAPPARVAVGAPAPVSTDSIRAGAPPMHTSPEAIRAGAPPAPRRTRWALWTIVAMLLVLAGVAAGGWWRIHRSIASNEEERFQAALKLYDQREFADASSALQKLHREFPDSPDNKKYRFLAELSDVREAVYGPRESADDLAKALQRVLQLAGMYKNDPLLKERETDMWLTLDDLARQLAQSAESEKAPTQLALAKRAWAESKNYAAPANVSKADRERKLEDEWSRIDRMLAAHQERELVIATIRKNMDRTTAAGVQESWTLMEKTKRQDDAEIRGLLGELFKAHREQAKFVAEDTPAKAAKLDDDALPSLSVTPSVQMIRPVVASKPILLALARGVLYALEPAKGELLWARRVGIDTHVLPLRVPADAITPELLLVLSSDQRSLSGVIAQTGATLWQTPLSEACLGTPVLVDRQVLVTTSAGRIDEIEIAEGRRLGSYLVGQPLNLGGVHQSGTPLVYFPGDDFCIYVFDITKRTCTNILYTQHPAGSLRGLPILARGGKRDLLLVSQSVAPGRAEIKPYALPIEQPEQKPIEPILSVAGLSASPWHDAHRLAVLSGTGHLSLFGFRQKGTRDPLIFPFLKQDFVLDAGMSLSRCEIVHADAENLWTMTNGRLQRVEMAFEPMKGPGLVARWAQPIALGRLLHAVQALREPDGRNILFVTTQADDHPTCLCSAIDADDGKILWQRQLGTLPQQPPRLVGEQILFPDALGLLSFQPSDDKIDRHWRQAGDWILQDSGPGGKHMLLTAPDAIVRLSWPTRGTTLHVQSGAIDGPRKFRVFDVELPSVPHGTPALFGEFMLMPLQNGIIVRIDLKDGALVNGTDWRAVGAEEQSRGHVVPLSAAEFVITDGSRGLQRIACSDAKTWDKRASAQLSHRIVAPPVLLMDAGKPRLCVADASDSLTLLDADRLTALKRWSMPGKITAGPFVRAGKIGCIVGKAHLYWFDPNQNERVWQYSAADIIGEPHLIDGVLVVADAAGEFLALDPSSGRRLGAVLTLKANVAATAAPIAFGAGRAFVPLTDGTAISLPLEKLR